jgi:epoxyqueuosine reductase
MNLGSIRHRAQALGFPLVGVAPSLTAATWHEFTLWIENGYAGGLDYLARRSQERKDVRLLHSEARSLLLFAAPYPAIEQSICHADHGIVSCYALSEDYHTTCMRALEKLLSEIRNEFSPGLTGWVHVDSSPILERDFAQQAGLGWFGKNTMLIHPELGSWFFLAEMILSVPIEGSADVIPDRCGTCRRCLDSCPTQAFVALRVLDARRCISYLTIENKGSIPRELRPALRSCVFGCDICQTVCPWNRKLGANLQQTANSSPMELLSLFALNEADFRARFANSPILRAKRRGLLRNAAVALGNTGSAACVTVLRRALKDEDSLVREHAGWALMKLLGEGAAPDLSSAIAGETDPGTSADLRLSLREALDPATVSRAK